MRTVSNLDPAPEAISLTPDVVRAVDCPRPRGTRSRASLITPTCRWCGYPGAPLAAPLLPGVPLKPR